MTPEQMDVLRQTFRSVFELASDAIIEDLAYQGIAAWDSVGHMRLVAELETVFDVMLDTDEVLGLSDFARAVAIIDRHLTSAS